MRYCIFNVLLQKKNIENTVEFKLIRAEVKNWDVIIAPSKSPLLSYYFEVSNNSDFTLVPNCIDYATVECSDGHTVKNLRVYSSHDSIKYGEKDTLMFYKELREGSLTRKKIKSYVKKPYVIRISTDECNFIEHSSQDDISSSKKKDAFNEIIIKKKLFYQQRVE